MKSKLRIFSCLARTGGTLVSRCIGSMRGVALFSEIHPSGHQVDEPYNILGQAVHWHGLSQLVGPAAAATSFTQVARMIVQELDSKGLQPVIRDWAHLDFMAVPFLQEPCYRSMLVESLKDDFEVNQYHLVRHPVSQWFSTMRLLVFNEEILPLEKYLEGHYRHSIESAENGFVRYEDFCDNPEHCVQRISEKLDLTFDPDFISKWSSYTKVTGDKIKLDERSSGGRINPAEIPSVDSAFYKQLHDCRYYHMILELLGYDDVHVK